MKTKQLLRRIKDAWCVLTKRNITCIITKAPAEATPTDVFKDMMRCVNKHLYNAQISGDAPEYRSSTARYEMINSVLDDRSIILLSMYQFPTNRNNATPTIIYDCASDEDYKALAATDFDYYFD